MVSVKILGLKTSQRYAIRRGVVAAQCELLQDHPGLEVKIVEINDSREILKYTAVISYPSLMVNEKLVCIGRYPRKDEVAGWLRQSIEQNSE
jgi:hypothetical protein